MNSLITSLSVLFRNSKRSLMYGSMAAITVGLEELFENTVFNCPCEGNFTYGLAFLLVPAILLFFPGILLDKTLWRKHPREEDNPKKDKTKLFHRYFKTLFITFDVFIRASIAPVAWLVLSFLQQQYYTCAYFGPPLDKVATVTNATDKCQFTLGVRSKELEEHYQTRSQIAGWSLMLIALSVIFSSISFRRCVEKGKHLRLPSLEYYRHVEAKEALEQFHTKAKELAKQSATRHIQLLFQNANNKDFDGSIQEVSKNVLGKYGMFFVIPPESPTYKTPVITVDTPPRFPELFSETDGAEIPKNVHDRHAGIEHVKYLKQIQSTSENHSNVHGYSSKVRLSRQISIHTV